jgi:hypothetical protein
VRDGPEDGRRPSDVEDRDKRAVVEVAKTTPGDPSPVTFGTVFPHRTGHGDGACGGPQTQRSCQNQCAEDAFHFFLVNNDLPEQRITSVKGEVLQSQHMTYFRRLVATILTVSGNI